MTLARVFRKFDMELDNTTAKDVAIEKIYFTGYPRLTSGRTNGEGEVKVRMKHKRRPEKGSRGFQSPGRHIIGDLTRQVACKAGRISAR